MIRRHAVRFRNRRGEHVLGGESVEALSLPRPERIRSIVFLARQKEDGSGEGGVEANLSRLGSQ